MEMLRNLSENHRAEFPATTLSYSMVKIALLDDAFSESGSKPSRRSITAPKRYEKEKKERQKKIKKPENHKDIGHILDQILISKHARAKMS